MVLLVSIPGVCQEAFDQVGLSALVNKFRDALRDTGISVSAPSSGRKLILNDQDDLQLDGLLNTAAASLDLLPVILRESIPLYNRIKHCGDFKCGLHTICTIGYKLAKEKGQDQYFANVALKFI
jgi:eukaryotic translation initiation factor 2C